MNKKILITIIALSLILVVGIAGFGFYNSTLQQSLDNPGESRAISTPVVVPTASEGENTSANANVSEGAETTTVTSQLLKSGSFVDLDFLHYARGDVRIEQIGDEVFVNMQENFETNPDGPDLYVWVVKRQELGGVNNGVNTDESQYLSLGQLTKTKGAQSYKMSLEEWEEHNYAVVIWCRAFSQQFSNAVLS